MAAPASASLLYARGCGDSSFFNLRIFPSFLSSSSSLSPSSHSYSSSESCSSGRNNLVRKNKFGPLAMSAIAGNVSPKGIVEEEMGPDHLLVLVHGILAGPSDWTYFQAELKRQLGRNFLIYASSSNTYTKTFSGVDGAGRRLAEEVKEVVRKTESLKKISFLSHSLGGLFARYALAVLYARKEVGRDELLSLDETSKIDDLSQHGTVAGLKPISFITLATPHLGVRGRKQLPFLFGVLFLEKLVPPIAPILVGRTGRQLFLTDGKSNRPPLLLRMASDCEDGKFISALGSFRCRILYANTSYDRWRTSSIRRENELPKRPPRRSLEGYKHVVDVEYRPPVSCKGPNFHLEAAKAKEAAQNAPSRENTLEYHEIMEEEMIRGLQQLGWMKVDVSFHSAAWPFFAHNNIHVKNEWLHNAGAGVVAHVTDTLKQQECPLYITASL
ncbi:hypothetical protein V2J09_000369 [Rumex salicifolius]